VRFEVFTVVKIQVDVFWVVTPYCDVFRYVGILPQHNTTSQPKTPRLDALDLLTDKYQNSNLADLPLIPVDKKENIL
jgi:hypothetical protein